MTLKRTLRILSGCVCADFHRYSRRVVQRRVRKQLLSFLSTASFFCAFSTVGLAQIGIITTIAGGGPNNVLATDVPLCGPSTTALDSQQNLYVAIQCQSLVVRIDHATGILTIVAGNGSQALPPLEMAARPLMLLWFSRSEWLWTVLEMCLSLIPTITASGAWTRQPVRLPP